MRGVALLMLFATLEMPGLAEGASEPNLFAKFLGTAKAELAGNADKVPAYHRDTLLARLAILESQTDLVQALSRARAITNPFYSSLTLGGIAASELVTDPMASTNHFSEALAVSLNITKWTGENATSLGFLFGLVRHYPKEEAALLLAASRQAFDTWKGRDFDKSASLLPLCEATTVVAPYRAEELLLDVALTSNHYSKSVEYLAQFLFRQSPDRTLRLAEAHYQAKKTVYTERGRETEFFLKSVRAYFLGSE